MQDKIIDGKKIAEEFLTKLKTKISQLEPKKPTLAVILAGQDTASKIYVQSKKKACVKVGIRSLDLLFKENVKEEKLLKEIDLLNQNTEVNGILVQLPLPRHIDANKIIERINPDKDVDGLHPYSLGRLLREEPGFIPCTPLGIKLLLEKANIETAGKHVVIIGRSLLVGKPLAAVLLQNKTTGNATVTVAHSRTKNLAEITKTADILISAAGKPQLITGDMVKDQAVVIDVGINKQNGKVVGDVIFEQVIKKAFKITPVPKGVGPMTIALLMHNTYQAFELQRKQSKN